MFNAGFLEAWLHNDGRDGFRLGMDGLAMYCALDAGLKRTLFGSTYA